MIKAILYCFIYAILNVSGAAVIKLKLKGLVLEGFKDWIGFLMSIQVIVAFTLIFTSALVMFKALSSADFSFTIPIATGINFILTIILGYYLFKDHINFLSFVGFTLILGGIIILSLNYSHHAH
jgi:multidrug transporter EmrE-like cation transporter